MKVFPNRLVSFDSVSANGTVINCAENGIAADLGMYDFRFLSAQDAALKDCSGSKTAEKIKKAVLAVTEGGALGALIGSSFVGAVCACGGAVFGPQGTFFGAVVGTGAGAKVGGFVGMAAGAIASFFYDK